MCYDKLSGAHLEVKPQDYTSEHQTVRSRLTGQEHEIKFGPMPAAPDPSKGGEVPANPFMSLAQSHYMYAHPGILGKKSLKEWSDKTDYKNIPKHVRK